MRSFLSPKVRLQDSRMGGKGLFTYMPIAQGELIVDYSAGPGQHLTTKEADALYERGNDYMMQVDDDHFFVAVYKGELEDADCINHSCDPNCGIRGSLQIIAMRAIQPGEEITFDYAMCESSDYTMPCQCGSPKCRRSITGEDWRRKDLRRRYKGFFSAYLQREIDRGVHPVIQT